MKAVIYSRYGGPDVLSIGDVAKPVPGHEELLIRVQAAEVTKGDCELRGMTFRVKWFVPLLRLAWGITRPRRRQRILGGYFAGTVETVGSSVCDFQPGQAVYGCTPLPMGAYAEYLCLPARSTLVTKPDCLGFEEAASVPLGGLNALHFLNKAKLGQGERLLVIGAGGSIGSFAVQIGKARGAQVSAVDSADKENLVRTLGADHFIDYQQKDFWREQTRYDVVFNMVPELAYRNCIRVLAPGGRYVMGNPRLSDMIRSVITSRHTDKTVSFAFAGESREELRELSHLLESGAIKPIVDRVYPPEQAADAHRRVEREQRQGMVVLRTL